MDYKFIKVLDLMAKQRKLENAEYTVKKLKKEFKEMTDAYGPNWEQHVTDVHKSITGVWLEDPSSLQIQAEALKKKDPPLQVPIIIENDKKNN